MPTNSVRIAGATAVACAALLGGCGGNAPHANMSVMRAHGSASPLVSLGAGDALGRQIYLNDLVLASRGVTGAMPDRLTARPVVEPAAIATAPENLPGE